MPRTPITALSIVLLASPASAWAQDGNSVVLQPVSPWTLTDYEGSCVLARSFGDEASPTTLELRQYAPGAQFFVTLARREPMIEEAAPQFWFEGLGVPSAEGRAWLTELQNGYSAVRSFLYAGGQRNGVGPLISENRERDEHERGLTALNVAGVYAQPLALRVGSMAAPLSAVRDCMAAVVERWGIDPQVQRTLRQSARYDWRASRLGRMRLPDDVRRAENSGLLPVRLMIDVEGRVDGCARLTPIGTDEQISAYCQALTPRLRYSPAIGADGNAVRDFDVWGNAPIRTQAL